MSDVTSLLRGRRLTTLAVALALPFALVAGPTASDAAGAGANRAVSTSPGPNGYSWVKRLSAPRPAPQPTQRVVRKPVPKKPVPKKPVPKKPVPKKPVPKKPVPKKPVTTPVPGSAPAPVASPSAWSLPAKKGVASAVYLSQAPAKLTAVRSAWAYNWSATVPASTPQLQTVPMIWGSGSLVPGVVDTLKAGGAAGKYQDLLGFNEPDHSDQANMTPEQAIALWPQLMATGLRLGSPAPASPEDGWLARFMTLATQKGYRVDFIAVHFYPDFTSPGAVSALKTELQNLYAAYHKPIWITELGSVDIRPWGLGMYQPPSMAAAQSFLTSVNAMINSLPFVERYAWFTDNLASDAQFADSSLFDISGVASALGVTFAGLR